MSFTIEDFQRQYAKEHFARLTPEEQQEVLQALPLETRLAGLSAEQIEQVRQYLDRLAGGKAGAPRKSRRKK